MMYCRCIGQEAYTYMYMYMYVYVYVYVFVYMYTYIYIYVQQVSHQPEYIQPFIYVCMSSVI